MANARDELHKLEIFVNEEMGVKTFNQSGWHIAGTDSYEKVDEHLQALELIVKKDVDVFRFKKLDYTTFNQLQISCGLPKLTQAEYDLVSKVVKEIMED